MVEDRFYRTRVRNPHLKSFEVKVNETDLLVSTDHDIYDITLDIVIKYRNFITSYIFDHPSFQTSLQPWTPDSFAAQIIQDMILFSARVGVGPMAAVAGAISQYVGSDLRQFSRNVIIENGGDDYIFSERDVIASIYAGKSPFGDKLRIKLKAQDLPMGVCTSSGTIGHSLSFGRADAVTVLSKSAILADAAATAIGNRVKDKTCINESLHWGMSIEEVLGVLIIIDDKLGMAGQIELA